MMQEQGVVVGRLAWLHTGKVPGLALVEIDVDHGGAAVDAHHQRASADSGAAGELLGEVVEHELVVPRVEPEPRRQPGLHHAQRVDGHRVVVARGKQRARAHTQLDRSIDLKKHSPPAPALGAIPAAGRAAAGLDG